MKPYVLSFRAIPPQVCDAIVKSVDLARFEPAQVLSPNDLVSSDPMIRRSSVAFVDDGSWVHGLCWHFANLHNESEWGFDLSKVEKVQIGRYETGDHFAWHNDAFFRSVGARRSEAFRKITLIIQLSNSADYMGGNFELKDEIGVIYREPRFREIGTVYTFPSLMYHRVTPIESGSRFTLVAWLIGPPYR